MRGAELEQQLREARAREASAADRVSSEEALARTLGTLIDAVTAARQHETSCRTAAQCAGVPIENVQRDEGDDGFPSGLFDQATQARNRAADVVSEARDMLGRAQALVDATQQRIDKAQAQLMTVASGRVHPTYTVFTLAWRSTWKTWPRETNLLCSRRSKERWLTRWAVRSSI